MNVVMSRLSLRFVTHCGCLQRADVSVLRHPPPATPPSPQFRRPEIRENRECCKGLLGTPYILGSSRNPRNSCAKMFGHSQLSMLWEHKKKAAPANAWVSFVSM